jgi:glycosyltransferase involved in cell wall biosynthesis
VHVRELTVVVPAYNESRRIEASLEKLLAWLPEHVARFEIVVVDDGSDDGTGQLVTSRFGERVRVARRSFRGGKGAAVRAGVLAARHAWILMVDADLSIPIGELEKLDARTPRAPIVIGSKRAPGSAIRYPPLRRLFGGLGQTLISTCVVRGFHDTQCGFKLYRADVARELFTASRIDGFGFDFEVLLLAKRAGYAVEEVPVAVEHQLGSSVRVSSYLGVLSEVARVSLYRALGRYPKARGRRD